MKVWFDARLHTDGAFKLQSSTCTERSITELAVQINECTCILAVCIMQMHSVARVHDGIQKNMVLPATPHCTQRRNALSSITRMLNVCDRCNGGAGNVWSGFMECQCDFKHQLFQSEHCLIQPCSLLKTTSNFAAIRFFMKLPLHFIWSGKFLL